ncbi:MAG: M48 family metalloprotease [Deltaproteobacteria bacterium]|nr:M48 family metalloprotease [Deltaproteobacteria bacterium]
MFLIKRHIAVFLSLSTLFFLSCASRPPKPDEVDELPLLTEKEEIKFGNYVDAVVAARHPTLHDENTTQRVAEIGNKLAATSDRPHLPFTFKVLNTTEVNAFAAPGGFVYVTVGLLDILEKKDELASVMAHEIGHVCERHSVRAYYTAQKINAVLTLLDLGAMIAGYPPIAGMGGDILGDIGRIVANLTAVIISQGYSRSWESRADELGLQYSFKAGYDPQAMVSVLERFLRLEEERGEKIKLTILSSHPKTEYRISHIKSLIEKMGGGEKD